MKKSTEATLAKLNAKAEFNLHSKGSVLTRGSGFGSPPPKASEKFPFSDEELQQLSQLEGKAKKAFVRELREKYRAGRVSKLAGEL